MNESTRVNLIDARDRRRLADACLWAIGRLVDDDARPRHIARQLAARAEAINRGEHPDAPSRSTPCELRDVAAARVAELAPTRPEPEIAR